MPSAVASPTPPSADKVALERFIHQTDASPVDRQLLERFERLTGQRPHRFLRRGMVFSHRDLDLILDRYERGEPFYLFTGRGPSSESLHLGHSIPLEFTQWLQRVFRVPLILMLTDDMKLLHSPSLKFPDVRWFTVENAKDMLAFGFNPDSTFMFSNLDFVGGPFYENIIAVARHIRVEDVKDALGFTDANNVGMLYCCSTQSAGAFAHSFPGILGEDREKLRDIACLIPCAYDIDGYFREVRKHAETLGFIRPAFLYSGLLPALQGAAEKMSASVANSAIYLRDSLEVIREKLTAESAVDPDVVLQYLQLFLDDDDLLASVTQEYGDGQKNASDLRELLVDVVQQQATRFQKGRATVTDEVLKGFMQRRLLV
ncbi:tryptophanyl-tRNA synthetase [Aspergillus heteromorphus CBS 117.55]|uniref:tryptophan--tRNA ligase n=1 Tax=Aspergillus heteromorphus CBS 117.55 TaxID=1448321 RepID=A0A317VF74_9EURO|nr:tryptophanyl-tRNA synthetase [Aspergillus heteromorphus CBS 117.55]PWY73026.1 tryptophanyl-tRNA synthetase [Aspergillus heteromorphus CBS 117.55]